MKKAILIIMSLLSVIGCSARNSEKVTSFTYSETDSRAFNTVYKAEMISADSVRITVTKENQERCFIVGREAMDCLERILLDNNAGKPRGSYISKGILDGKNWGMSISYDNGASYSCDGYATWPLRLRKALREITAFFEGWSKKNAGDLTDFRFELYSEGRQEVLSLNKTEFFTGIYFRWFGDLEGWNFNCADSSVLVQLGNIINSYSLNIYPQTPVGKEDAGRDRWLVEGKYRDGSKIEVVKYIDSPESDLRNAIENIFRKETERISNLGPGQLGEHVKTSYTPDGKPRQQIRYTTDGTVCGGYDYNDPLKEF